MDLADDEVWVLGFAGMITARQAINLTTTASKVHDAGSQVTFCKTNYKCPDIVGLRRPFKTMHYQYYG